jgi:hypothetical protein
MLLVMFERAGVRSATGDSIPLSALLETRPDAESFICVYKLYKYYKGGGYAYRDCE